MAYDLIILLGSQPDIKTWKFPEQVITCLHRSKELLDEGKAPFIVASGKWSTRLDTLGIQQPFRECDKLEELLIDVGVPKEKILKDYREDKITQYDAILKIDDLRSKNKHLVLTDVPVNESNINAVANKPVMEEDYDDWEENMITDEEGLFD